VHLYLSTLLLYMGIEFRISGGWGMIWQWQRVFSCIHGMVLDLVNSSSKFSISILMPKSLHWLLFMGWVPGLPLSQMPGILEMLNSFLWFCMVGVYLWYGIALREALQSSHISETQTNRVLTFRTPHWINEWWLYVKEMEFCVLSNGR